MMGARDKALSTPSAQAATDLQARSSSGVRSVLTTAGKALLTVAAFYLLLTHPVRIGSGQPVMALRAILDYLPHIDAGVFWRFTLLATAVKGMGIFASMLRWYVLLRGQGIIFPLWHIVTTFLIGRFLGTFLPSTIGLDAYKLYDAARFSGRTVEAAAATVVEKGLGIIGIFLAFLVTLPLGYHILGARAGLIAALTVPTALAVIGIFFVVAFKPEIIAAVLDHVPVSRRARVASVVQRVNDAAAAYKHQKPLLLLATALSFLVHLFTAAMYFCTALAIGAEHADFWEVSFASTIQIFATVMSPFTIAGEGVREIVQTVLLAQKIGTSQSILSAALGFWAAEAPTLIGGVFYAMRPACYHPEVTVLPRRTAESPAQVGDASEGR